MRNTMYDCIYHMKTMQKAVLCGTIKIRQVLTAAVGQFYDMQHRKILIHVLICSVYLI